MIRFLGIDPGKAGSVSIIDGDHVTVYPTPLFDDEYDAAGMFKLLQSECDNRDEVFCVIERSQSMPKQGVVSMFTFGKGYGMWLMALAGLQIPHTVVHSRTWTKKMLMGAPGEGKERAYLVARRMFPNWAPTKKKEWEYADSILLAQYGRETHGAGSR